MTADYTDDLDYEISMIAIIILITADKIILPSSCNK